MTDRFANLFNALKAQKDGALVETEKLYTPEEMRAHFRARANGK